MSTIQMNPNNITSGAGTDAEVGIGASNVVNLHGFKDIIP